MTSGPEEQEEEKENKNMEHINKLCGHNVKFLLVHLAVYMPAIYLLRKTT